MKKYNHYIPIMKRIITAFLLAIVCCCVNAQKLNFGIEAGYVRNHLSVVEYHSSDRNGFKVGGLVECELSSKISFESGLAYIRKGASTYGTSMLKSGINRIKFAEMDYLQIPLMAGYRVSVCKNVSIKPQVGVYYAVGVGGDSFVSGTDSFNQPFEARVRTFSGSDGVAYRPCNRNDLGLSFAFDIKYRHIGIKLGYDLSFLNSTYYGNGKHRTLSLSATYWIK